MNDREIVSERHRQRVLEDPEYASRWPEPAEEEPEPVAAPVVVEHPIDTSVLDKKLAMVVPTFSPDPRRLEMARITCSTWRKEVDELIVIEDGGIFDSELAKIANIYIYHADNIGPCNNMNMGWQLAHARGADFVAIADSDVQLYRGRVRNLCVPGKVCVPTVAQHPQAAAVIAPMLCVPREVTEAIGMYDDRGGAHRNESFDADLASRYVIHDSNLITKSNECWIWHTGSATRFNHGWAPFPENA